MALALYIEKAEYLGNFVVGLKFSDGLENTVDFKDFLNTHSHPQYDKYKNERTFRKFQIEDGNIVWGKNWDLIFPIEELHEGRVG